MRSSHRKAETWMWLAAAQLWVVLATACAPSRVPAGSSADQSDLIIDDSVAIVTDDGATIAARVARPAGAAQALPTILLFNIYRGFYNIPSEAERAARRGYVGVVANTRGKGFSPDEIVPYEHDGADAHAVIEWIVRQPWSNGEVGMFSGSYLGFTQWAAAKHAHPALKTIVPQVANLPGPAMTNNIIDGHRLPWLHFVTNNDTVDAEYYDDEAHWTDLHTRWFESGRPFRDLDELNGRPNKIFQRWLDHPDHDEFWQAMVPYGREYARIDIPVLTITGYFDGAQLGALHYFKEHYKYHQNPNHYLVIGPYDHISGQNQATEEVGGYELDPVADLDLDELAYQWLDHILKGAEKPSLLQDKVNFQVMGTNAWRHAPTLDAMADDSMTFYLAEGRSGARNLLALRSPERVGELIQTVDFRDRETENNYFSPLVVSSQVDVSNGLSFLSEPFEQAFELNGAFTGELRVVINKRDFDPSLVLYEVTADGAYFQLSRFVGRASYVSDPSRRELLTPGEPETVAFRNTFVTSKKIDAGSRLLLLVNVNKHPFDQINYGTGKNVSDESIADATVPLTVRWRTDSFIRVPVTRGLPKNLGLD